jgi:hypothetical protein
VLSRTARLALVLAVCVVSTALAPATAAAGAYTVRQCDHAAGIGHHDFRWQAAGSPALVPHTGSGCGEFGLGARNGAPGVNQTYPSGGYGGWFAYAPPGTAITRFAGAFGTLAGCCINGLATYAEATEQADGSGFRSYLFQGNLGNDTWYAPSGLQGPVGRSWNATSGFAAKRVGFQVRCGPGFSCYQQKTGDLRVRARSFDFTVRDDVAPALVPSGGTLLTGGWLRGVRGLSFGAWDGGGGLTGVTATFDNGTVLWSQSTCNRAADRYTRLQPCPLARTGGWDVDTAKLPDGARTVTVRAVDAGGATVQQVRAVHVDNTPPAAPLEASVIGGSGWRRSNVFAARWRNPGGQAAPIVGARFSACPIGDGGCVAGSRAGHAITSLGALALPRAGEWKLRIGLVDAAGNSDAEAATPPLQLRYDPDPPQLRFLPRNSAYPRRIAVAAADVSGLASGRIELRRVGSGTWRPLPTDLSRSLLTADIDDGRHRGLYELRAWATDAAGNRSIVSGTELSLPLRRTTRLVAAIVERAARRTTARARHGSLVVIRGRLTAAGAPLANRRVAVRRVSRTHASQLPPVLTGARGRIATLLRARTSAVVQLRFAGDDRVLPSTRRLAIHVPAPATIKVDRRAVRGGERVTFHGRVRGGAIPRRGKLVEVQAHFRDRWRTISAVRSTRAGRWRFAYRFQAAGRTARYRMRARVPAEAGYPFAAGASRPIRVTVLAR